MKSHIPPNVPPYFFLWPNIDYLSCNFGPVGFSYTGNFQRPKIALKFMYGKMSL